MRKKIWITAAVVLACVIVGCGVYVNDYYRADETAVSTVSQMQPGIRIAACDEGMLFDPGTGDAGLIFYPGGKVEYTAYAPLMCELAHRGVVCVLTQMPLNLAVLDMNAADGIAEKHPQVQRWYIAGHSLGGSMAASYAASHANELEGLILLAAYSTEDLAQTGLDVLSMYGSEDGVLNMDKYEQYRTNLPNDATEMVIEGGNHAGFGSYGAQDGDGEAAIPAQEQRDIAVEAILEMIGVDDE